MDRKRFNIILIIGSVAVVLFFVGIRLITQSIDNELTIEVEKIKEELRVAKEVRERLDRANNQKRVLKSTNLTPYQIVPQRKSRLFKNQQYWDVLTRNALEQSTVTNRIQEGEIFKGITKTPKEFKKEIRMIDGRIKVYKKKIRSDPSDDYARRKLQDLYMLKSTVRVLRETIVSQK